MTKKWLLISTALALVVATPLAWAGVAFKNLSPETSLRSACYHLQVAATSNDLGDDGVVFRHAHGTATSISQTTSLGDSANTTFATIPYPSVLALGLSDASANDTLTCSSVTIKGYDAFGRPHTETVSGVTETMGAAETTRAFSQIYSVVATCSAGSDAGDALVIGTGLKVGAPARTRKLSDIESVYIVDSSDSNAIKSAGLNTGDSSDVESNFTILTDVLNSGSAIFGDTGGTEVAAADGDTLCLRVRSSLNNR